MSTLFFSFLVLAISAIICVMAIPALRHRIVGESPLANAAVPLLAGALVWLANWSGGILADFVTDSTAPRSNLKVIVEEIVVGYPEIPENFNDRYISRDELTNILSPFRRSSIVVRLKEPEVIVLNSISINTSQASKKSVSIDRDYTMKEVAGLLENAIYFLYRYKRWSAITEKWSSYFKTPSDRSSHEIISKYVSEHVFVVPNSGGIFQGLAGMVDLKKIKLSDVKATDCTPAKQETRIRTRIKNGKIQIDWGGFSTHVTSIRNRARTRAARQFVNLINNGCFKTLSEIFLQTSRIFKEEVDYMEKYLKNWKEIFSAREPDNMGIIVTVSNVGKFDTFIRREIRAVIGGHGKAKKIPLILVNDSLTKDRLGGVSPYLPVKSRSASTFRFSAIIEKKKKKAVYHAFNSDLNFIRVGILASSGGSTEAVLSPVTPFSKKEKEKAKMQIENLKVEF